MAASDTRVTRGKLLKRAGVGAAALGAGSLLTAGTANAKLATSAICISVGCGYDDCPGGTGCCYCTVNREGCCNCFEDMYCSGLNTCVSSSQCPPGWACQAYTCGEAGVCVVHCGANVDPSHLFCGNAVGAKGGRTTRQG
jgi:hypothetical protein